ncbi:FtsX-like permease family protein [Streptomyces qinzhouensis]|uniref:FtsX-like permease family protein n=1 Tax=Streptomyces qinzhouensis TaxID=2599401 RepID=A0A5B8JDP8_9ACTN|nr:FtsX-like permease family protein [Streptomyces qinzhouensis]QDY79506.1 FtsX-like permease family protein [Streptomyces qinzhouensis]
MTAFLFHRARGHLLLLSAVLLAVLLTASVLAALTAFAGSVGDAGLRHALQSRDAAAASLIITSEDSAADRDAAAEGARRGSERAFDGLPVTLRPFERSAPYSLPRALQPPAARQGEPDLTMLAVVDRSKVRLASGAWPAPKAAGPVVEVALPEAAARALKLTAGPRVLTLASRLGGPAVQIRVAGVYRINDRHDPYWQLDELRGRSVRADVFTTYGPLLADPRAFASERIAKGGLSWLATADFGALEADRIDALRSSVRQSQKQLSAQPGLKGGVVAKTSLPEILDRMERALLVARATLLIVSLQLVLLAGYALLLVARLLSTERESETRFLLARGASRRRIAALSALEALFLALPAVVCAPLLAGPLTALLAGQGPLARIGLRVDTAPTASVWLVGAVVALACAVAVVAPAIGAARRSRGRAGTLPAPVRAGADIALVAVAGVAYWQLERRTSGSGALSGDRGGDLGIDPLLVVAPALALLAGTVLTLRLLPPAARLAERRAVRGRGLTSALAGWQLSRRPARGAGPALLLVLAVALGMLAIGQSASWDRSQDDQADFRAGAPVRVLGGATVPFGQGGAYDGMPGLRTAVPAARQSMALTGGRQATVLALDTRRAARDDGAAGGGLRLRRDLAEGGDPYRSLAALRPRDEPRAGVVLPGDTRRLELDITLGGAYDGPYGTAALDADTYGERGLSASVTVEDRYGVPYRLPLGNLLPDGKRHRVVLDLAKAAEAPVGRPAGPLALTAVEFDEEGFPDRIAAKRLTVGALRSIGPDGTARPVAVPEGLSWRATATAGTADADPAAVRPAVTKVTAGPGAPVDLRYHTGTAEYGDGWGPARSVTVRVTAVRPPAPQPLALATKAFLAAGDAKVGSRIQVPMQGGDITVRIAGVLEAVPTTGPGSADPAAARPELDGGALLLDLRAVNRVLAERPDASFPPGEWWLFTAPRQAAQLAAALRDRAEVDPSQILVRDEIARGLHEDPLGAGPQSALLATAAVAALLAAVGFAVGTVGALRERSSEFAVLRALGAPRRLPARLLAVEQSLLIGLGLLIGAGIGTVLTRAVVPLIVLTGGAARPVPEVLVELPVGRVVLLLVGVAAAPVLIVAALMLRRTEPAAALRVQGGE